MNGGHAAILVAAVAVGGCQGETAGGSASDAQVVSTEAGEAAASHADATVVDALAPGDSSTSSIATPDAPGAPADAGAALPSDVAVDSPAEGGEAGAPDADARDAESGECGPLGHGPAVTTVLRSIFDAGGLHVPADDGGPIATGTYYLTARAVLSDPNYAPAYTCDGQAGFELKDTYRFTSTSATTGFADEDIERDWPDGGISRQITSASYVITDDPSFEHVTFTDTCPDNQMTLLEYIAGPTEITTVLLVGLPIPSNQPGVPVCTIISTYTKQ